MITDTDHSTVAGPRPALSEAPYSPPGALPKPTMLFLATLALRGRRLIAGTAVGAALATGIVSLLLPKKYTTTVSFTPVASMDLPAAGLAGLAGQFGMNLGANDPSQSPDFYGALLQTRQILQPLVETRYTFRDDGKLQTGTFADFYDITDADSGRRTSEAMRVLQARVLRVAYDRETSIVTIDVCTKWPELSLLMSERLLQLVDNFNVNTRRTEGGQEFRFVSQRVDTARSELRTAEGRLQDFVTQNRGYATDPSLSFEHDRLARELSLRQDVYTTLTQAMEQARLRSARNTASVSVVEAPRLALRPDRRHILEKCLGAFFGGAILAVFLLLGSVALSNTQENAPSEHESLQRLWVATKNDIRRLTFRRSRAA